MRNQSTLEFEYNHQDIVLTYQRSFQTNGPIDICYNSDEDRTNISKGICRFIGRTQGQTL